MSSSQSLMPESNSSFDRLLSSKTQYVDDDQLTSTPPALINASPVSMGLLSTRGPPAWHPATQDIKYILLENWWCSPYWSICRQIERVELNFLTGLCVLRRQFIAQIRYYWGKLPLKVFSLESILTGRRHYRPSCAVEPCPRGNSHHSHINCQQVGWGVVDMIIGQWLSGWNLIFKALTNYQYHTFPVNFQVVWMYIRPLSWWQKLKILEYSMSYR